MTEYVKIKGDSNNTYQLTNDSTTSQSDIPTGAAVAAYVAANPPSATAGATSHSEPSAPTGTSASFPAEMVGLAGSITPATSGKVLVVISCDAKISSAGSSISIRLRYGTGSAPANGDSLTGTAIGAFRTVQATTANYTMAMSVNAVITGLSVGTAYWLDLQASQVNGGTINLYNVSISAIEA